MTASYYTAAGSLGASEAGNDAGAAISSLGGTVVCTASGLRPAALRGATFLAAFGAVFFTTGAAAFWLDARLVAETTDLLAVFFAEAFFALAVPAVDEAFFATGLRGAALVVAVFVVAAFFVAVFVEAAFFVVVFFAEVFLAAVFFVAAVLAASFGAVVVAVAGCSATSAPSIRNFVRSRALAIHAGGRA